MANALNKLVNSTNTDQIAQLCLDSTELFKGACSLDYVKFPESNKTNCNWQTVCKAYTRSSDLRQICDNILTVKLMGL